ncbi:MAG: hypothetical protein AB8U93_00035 [Francisella endosymbiont of Hyalomma scupense]
MSKSITKKLYIYGYKICMILGLAVITVVMLISIIFDIHYSYITFCTVAMVYNFVLGMYQTSSNTVMYSVIDHEKLDSFNTIKNSGNMISSAIVLTIFTLVYDIYHNYVIYHHWLQIFEEAYFCIVVTSAVVQIIMVVWIALRMDNY